jgi:hypothetical protein
MTRDLAVVPELFLTGFPALGTDVLSAQIFCGCHKPLSRSSSLATATTWSGSKLDFFS